ncbi:Uncharacterised protein [Burkholderia pseudomallei]|nr:Uncharacterised protein [Burkholderia pseudomallei]
MDGDPLERFAHVGEALVVVLAVAGEQALYPFLETGRFGRAFEFDRRLARGRIEVVRALRGELQRFGAEARRVVGRREPDEIRLADVGEVGVDFDRREELLALLRQRDELVGRIDLRIQRHLPFQRAVFDFGRLQRDHVAIRAERVVRRQRRPALDVLDVHACAVQLRVVVLRHLREPFTLDLATVDGRAFHCDAEEFGFACHREGRTWLSERGSHVRRSRATAQSAAFVGHAGTARCACSRARGGLRLVACSKLRTPISSKTTCARSRARSIGKAGASRRSPAISTLSPRPSRRGAAAKSGRTQRPSSASRHRSKYA